MIYDRRVQIPCGRQVSQQICIFNARGDRKDEDL